MSASDRGRPTGEGGRPATDRCRHPLDPLVDVMDRLLGPGGCPWDQEQTHASLRPYVVEEAYEVVGAIDSGDPAKLKDELGDLLLQVVFHAALASREGRFGVDDVVAAITGKLVRRHPHVFGESQAHTAGAVLRQWEDIKKEEAATAETGPRLEAHLPALMQAQKLLERAARLGHPLPAGGGAGAPATPLGGAAAQGAPAAATASRGTATPADEVAYGWALMNLLETARRRGVDAELALRQACARLAAQLDRPAGDAPESQKGPAGPAGGN